MTSDITVRPALCAIARAQLAAAEADALPPGPDRDAARRRVWRERAAVASFSGRSWPEADAMGVEL